MLKGSSILFIDIVNFKKKIKARNNFVLEDFGGHFYDHLQANEVIMQMHNHVFATRNLLE